MSRNCCIHSRIDVRAKSVKGRLVRIKMRHTNFEKGSVVFKSVVVKQLFQKNTAFDFELFANEKR